MPKRSYQPKKLKRVRKHGFLSRMSTKAGQKVIKSRRVAKRKKISL